MEQENFQPIKNWFIYYVYIVLTNVLNFIEICFNGLIGVHTNNISVNPFFQDILRFFAFTLRLNLTWQHLKSPH